MEIKIIAMFRIAKYKLNRYNIQIKINNNKNQDKYKKRNKNKNKSNRKLIKYSNKILIILMYLWMKANKLSHKLVH